MADIKKFLPQLFKWEGGYAEDPADLGGATNRGVTLKMWLTAGYDKNNDGVIDKNDLKMITKKDVVKRILKPHYWDRWQADHIQNQSLAELLVDWVWTSGTPGIRIPQSVLKVKADGIVGKNTLNALNSHPDQESLFDRIKSERTAYIERICKARPANNRFKKGWLNRLASFRFVPVMLLFFCLSWGGCKSVPQQKSVETSSERDEWIQKDVDSVLNRQVNQWVFGNEKQDSEEESVSETVVIQYNTLLPEDSTTGIFPVQSVTRTVVTTSRKTNASSNGMQQSVTQQLSEFTDKSKITVSQKSDERQQQAPGKDPYRWRYIAVAVIIVVILITGWFLFKRIAGR